MASIRGHTLICNLEFSTEPSPRILTETVRVGVDPWGKSFVYIFVSISIYSFTTRYTRSWLHTAYCAHQELSWAFHWTGTVGISTIQQQSVTMLRSVHLPLLHLHAVLELQQEGRRLHRGAIAAVRQRRQHPRHRRDLQLQRLALEKQMLHLQ